MASTLIDRRWTTLASLAVIAGLAGATFALLARGPDANTVREVVLPSWFALVAVLLVLAALAGTALPGTSAPRRIALGAGSGAALAIVGLVSYAGLLEIAFAGEVARTMADRSWAMTLPLGGVCAAVGALASTLSTARAAAGEGKTQR